MGGGGLLWIWDVLLWHRRYCNKVLLHFWPSVIPPYRVLVFSGDMYRFIILAFTILVLRDVEVSRDFLFYLWSEMEDMWDLKTK